MASVVIIKNIFRSAMVFSEMQFYQFKQMFIWIFSYEWLVWKILFYIMLWCKINESGLYKTVLYLPSWKISVLFLDFNTLLLKLIQM